MSAVHARPARGAPEAGSATCAAGIAARDGNRGASASPAGRYRAPRAADTAHAPPSSNAPSGDDRRAMHYLRTAEPQALPGYPVAGLAHPDAAGAAAALLAHSSAKPVGVVWRPDPSSAAGAAASLAHARKKPDMWMAAAESVAGKAALHALAAASAAAPPPAMPPRSSKQWSLDSALCAMEVPHSRERSKSPGVLSEGSVDTSRGGKHAIAAALSMHSPSMEPSAEEHRGNTQKDHNNAGGISKQAQQSQDVLRAATLSMRAAKPEPASSPPAYPHLEEAARIMAQRRLSLIDYTPAPSPAGLRQRRVRSLSASNVNQTHTIAESVDADTKQRQDEIAKADKLKRGRDAVMLMNAARHNVDMQMSGIDRRVSESRGLHRREDWEPVATRLAQRDSDARQTNYGKIDIGGGAYMEQDAIDAIAQKRVRPVLEELDRKARTEHQAKERERIKAQEERWDREHEKRMRQFRAKQERETEKELRRAKEVEKRRHTHHFSGVLRGLDRHPAAAEPGAVATYRLQDPVLDEAEAEAEANVQESGKRRSVLHMLRSRPHLRTRSEGSHDRPRFAALGMSRRHGKEAETPPPHKSTASSSQPERESSSSGGFRALGLLRRSKSTREPGGFDATHLAHSTREERKPKPRFRHGHAHEQSSGLVPDEPDTSCSADSSSFVEVATAGCPPSLVEGTSQRHAHTHTHSTPPPPPRAVGVSTTTDRTEPNTLNKTTLDNVLHARVSICPPLRKSSRSSRARSRSGAGAGAGAGALEPSSISAAASPARPSVATESRFHENL